MSQRINSLCSERVGHGGLWATGTSVCLYTVLAASALSQGPQGCKASSVHSLALYRTSLLALISLTTHSPQERRYLPRENLPALLFLSVALKTWVSWSLPEISTLNSNNSMKSRQFLRRWNNCTHEICVWEICSGIPETCIQIGFWNVHFSKHYF